jgi:hypothetical protein
MVPMPGSVVVPTPGVVAGGVAEGVAAGCFDGEDVAALADVALLVGVGAAVTVTVVAAVGAVGREGVASAVAVRVTDVPAVVPDGTVICACIVSDEAVTSVARSPTVQEVPPSPPGHLPVNVGGWPARVPARATLTPVTGPFSVETCTVQVAAWPAWMLSWDA